MATMNELNPGPATVTAKAFDPRTGDWTRDVKYEARNWDEARNWVKFNRDWMKGFQINGKAV